MAEFALGLTKTAVAGTVSRVKAAIEEEGKLRVRIQDDLVYITGEFEMMQSFLSASNAGERAFKNKVVRTWVRQLRDLAFDVEDCVEFVVHLDKATRWDWVHRLASSVLVCSARPPLPLDVAVAEIKRLKARVEDVSQRNSRYNLMGGSGDDSSPAAADHQLTSTTGSSEVAAAGAFQVLKDVWKAAGKLGVHTAVDLKKLIDCHGSELQVVSLWCRGASDVRDDAPPPNNHVVMMMKKAYDDPEICHVFKYRAWVKLTPHQPFNPVEFLTNLLTQFRSRHRHHLKEDDHGNSISELLLQLSQLTYLVVIEQGLTTIADWDAIRMYLPDGNNGSRVVVPTDNLGIALVCTGDPYQVSELKRFSHHKGLYAFSPKGSGHRIGMGELIWQLRRPGVISVLWETNDDYNQLMQQLYCDTSRNFTVLDGVKFEYSYWYEAAQTDHQFDLDNFILGLLGSSYPEEEQDDELEEKLTRMTCQDRIDMCRKFLTEHDCIICIENIVFPMDWDLVKRDLLSQSTRGCIVVITNKKILASHCVDHESRALNAEELLKGSEQQGYHGHGHQGGNIMEENKFELGKLVGREYDDFGVYTHEAYFMKTSVWGIAGVGKSALVRETYFRSKINTEFRMYAWVDVPHPFNLTDLCQLLLLDIFLDDVEAKEAAAIAMMEGQDPIQWCSKILHEKKFLLVFDGLQSKHDWDLIHENLLSQPINGTIIVITREESTAIHCATDQCLVRNIKCLEDRVARDLFSKVALDEEKLSPNDEEILNLMISKCGGLPAIIIAIAGIRNILGRLEDVNARFMGILERESGLSGLFCWMQSYFDACSDELKPCIFYILVFPADQIIRRRRLIRRWIAEGYSPGGSGTADEKGEELLSELMRLSILYVEQQTLFARIKSCKVNGFFREYIKSRPMEDNLVFELEGSSSPSSRLTGQHLTISSSWDRDEVVFNTIDLSRLRSLTVFGGWRSFLICDKMKILRVLDLEGTDTSDVTTSVTDNVLEQIMKLLPRLKFLSLRRCVHITRLPDSLGDMRQLQTLDVRYTSVVELPSAIAKLHKLQYIRAGTSTDISLLLLHEKTSPSPPPPPPPPPPPTPPQEHSHSGRSPFLQVTARARVVQGALIRTSVGCKRRTHDYVASSRNICWQSKNQLDLCTRRRVSANGGGVEVFGSAAEGVGRLTHLHTLGVVNVAGGKGAFLFLQELKKLTQLRKLGLSGISRENWRRLCDAISGNLHHLESLSLQLMLLEEGGSFDFACFQEIAKPPKTLTHLKVLYTTTGGHASGGACLRLAWIHQFPNLKRFDHELRISSQEDIDILEAGLHFVVRCLCIEPVEEHLSFELPAEDAHPGYTTYLDSLRIQCSSTLSHSKVTFGDLIPFCVRAISIHCCCSSSTGTGTRSSLLSCNLKIAGLDRILSLREVSVPSTYAEDLKRDLRKQLEKHENKPDLTLREAPL